MVSAIVSSWGFTTAFTSSQWLRPIAIIASQCHPHVVWCGPMSRWSRCLFPNPKKTVRQMRADKFQFSVFRKVVATWRFCWPWQHWTAILLKFPNSKLPFATRRSLLNLCPSTSGFGLGTPWPLRLRSASWGRKTIRRKKLANQVGLSSWQRCMPLTHELGPWRPWTNKRQQMTNIDKLYAIRSCHRLPGKAPGIAFALEHRHLERDHAHANSYHNLPYHHIIVISLSYHAPLAHS